LPHMAAMIDQTSRNVYCTCCDAGQYHVIFPADAPMERAHICSRGRKDETEPDRPVVQEN
jgi:hypothetical protein